MEWLRRQANLDEETVAKFQRYCDELMVWNERTNLTAILDPGDIEVQHFADSLAVLQALPERSDLRIIDIGTGAGFPGIPIKLLMPDCRLTLVEAVGKKTDFLRHIVEVLRLGSVAVVRARVEELGRDPQFREAFDVATSRAVGELSILSEYALPVLRLGGRLIAQKGADLSAELAAATKAINTLGGKIGDAIPYELPGLEKARTLVVIDKIAPTPPNYPRRPGIPGKRPL